MSKRLTLENFVNRARSIHGDKYDYSKVEWVNSKHRVCIVCPVHGDFFQVPSEHLSGCGCMECGGRRKKTTAEFIAEAKEIWGDKIDFSQTVYNGGKVKTLFICPTHGFFMQYPRSLLNGHGCQKCGWNSWKTKVFGVGINDLNVGGKNPLYTTWRGMLQRGYDNKIKSKYPTYTDVFVCTEWLTLSNFKKWFDENYIEGYCLDKDILVKGNKVYSPDTCCFVPKEINIMIKTSRRNNKGLPIGVTTKGKLFAAAGRFGGRPLWIGGFITPEAAFLAYKKAKEQYVKELAEKYFKEGKITERVYLALLNYQVEITD